MPKPKANHKVFKIPQYILSTAKVLQWLSPKLATRFVFKLFRTAFKFKRPSKEQIMYDKASKEMLLIPELKKKIRVYKYGNTGERVLLVHGWAGRGTQLYKIAELLCNEGFQVISFDATAHGESEGKESSMLEFISSIFELEKKYGPFDYAVGHSLGAMALLNAVKQGFILKRIALIGSGNSITAICNRFVKRLDLKPKIAISLKKMLDSALGEDSELLSAYIAARSVKIPTLVIHDTKDTDVPLDCAKDIEENLENGQLLITEGLGHRRILSTPEVIIKMIVFFRL